MKVLLAAEESAGAHALQLVVERGHQPVGVLTTGSADESGVHAAARRLAVPTLDPARVRDGGFASWVAAREVDLFLNVHSLHIAHPGVLEAPAIGSFNLHPGPLPRYAGLDAPSWAIYEGERRHAATVHWMTGTVDAGAVAYEAWFDIGPRDTGLRVATNCVRHGLPLLDRLLEDAAGGPEGIPATPQDPGQRRWFGRGAPHDGLLPWHLPARRIVDLVRASSYAPYLSPWGWPRATLDGRELEIVRVAATGLAATAAAGTVGDHAAGGVPVAAADEWVLVERLRAGGESADPGSALLPGQRFDPAPGG